MNKKKLNKWTQLNRLQQTFQLDETIHKSDPQIIKHNLREARKLWKAHLPKLQLQFLAEQAED
jgi:hypothetical protein